MATCSISRPPLLPSSPTFHHSKHSPYFTKTPSKSPQTQKQTRILAISNSPKGFGPPPKKTKTPKKVPQKEDEQEYEQETRGTDVIPEIVTNRMISRMGFSVGIPLFIGLMFFPLFYYLKVVQKIDVPSWVPVIVSFVFFGTALGGVSYGIVSSSWDPMREGSRLGWTEAQKNWPVFWQSLWGSDSRRK